MNQTCSLLAAIAIGAMMSGVSFAQEGATSQHTTGTVVEGNTTMVFKTANKSDVHMKSLKQWTTFAQAHPQNRAATRRQANLAQRRGLYRKASGAGTAIRQ